MTINTMAKVIVLMEKSTVMNNPGNFVNFIRYRTLLQKIKIKIPQTNQAQDALEEIFFLPQ